MNTVEEAPVVARGDTVQVVAWSQTRGKNVWWTGTVANKFSHFRDQDAGIIVEFEGEAAAEMGRFYHAWFGEDGIMKDGQAL